jgi:hypothetical protein
VRKQSDGRYRRIMNNEKTIQNYWVNIFSINKKLFGSGNLVSEGAFQSGRWRVNEEVFKNLFLV